MADEEAGASNNERLLAAAREDNEEMLTEIFEEGNFDINYHDGLGNTALHYAVQQCSTDVLEHILSHDECDVDPVNRISGSTPLHIAVQIEDAEMRKYLVESLLDAGADLTIRDKDGEVAPDLLPSDDKDTAALIRKAKAQASVSKSDVADDDEDDGEYSGSGSGSESE